MEKNRLSQSHNPYLLQHQHHPVDWYPWGEEALTTAKTENKLLIVSIGYSTCHWCHVMAHEVFEEPQVATLQNRGFISIKVDREERPDLDNYYMDACRLLSGQGGWPLNAICLPDGRPIHAVTYLPKESWIQLLGQVRLLWVESPEKLIAQAEAVAEGLVPEPIPELPLNTEPLRRPLENIFRETWSRIKPSLDPKGGSVGAPKFPLFPFLTAWQEICQLVQQTHGDSPEWLTQAETHLLQTLKAMSLGGIHDQIGGGLFRYSTDDHWHIPHFEKMLYDNAQWIGALAKTQISYPRPLLKRSLILALEWTQHDLRNDEDLYASALDADSEGEEGTFYCLTQNDVFEALPNSPRIEETLATFDILGRGNWEDGKNVPQVAPSKVKSLDDDQILQQLIALDEPRQQLNAWREKRVKPFLDDKNLLEWNALMVKNLIDAARALDDVKLLSKALDTLDSLWENFKTKEGTFLRSVRHGQPGAQAFLPDLAHLAQALFAAHQSTLKTIWIERCVTVVDYAITHFESPDSPLFAIAKTDVNLKASNRPEIEDNVTPSGNSTLALVLLSLGELLHREEYRTRALRMIQYVRETALNHPMFHSQWLLAFARSNVPVPVLTLYGKESQRWAQGLWKFSPQCVVQQGEGSDDGIEICVGTQCLASRKSFKETLQEITKIMRL